MLSRILFVLSLTLFFSCTKKQKEELGSPALKLVTTTTMITDMAKKLGGELVEVEGLMGPGVDPHLYKASEGDVNKIFEADAIVSNGLHLEGKLEEVLGKIAAKGTRVITLADTLPKEALIPSENFASSYDPHIWFNIHHWRKTTIYLAERLMELDPQNAALYTENLNNYLRELDEASERILTRISALPQEKRILVTAHDAFNYFGQAYNFEVLGLQGISTATEAGVRDVQQLANYIVEHKVKAIFVESSVPRKNIEALQEAVQSKGFKVKIGGELFSDAGGSAGTDEETYIGMFEHNVNTIVDALL